MPRKGPSAAPRGGSGTARAPSTGNGARAGPLRLAEGPDVVVAEEAVHPGLHRRVGGIEGLVGSVTKRRQHDAGADHDSPPWRAANAPPTAPARSPKVAGTITARGRRSPPSTKRGEARPGRVDEQAAGLHDAAAEHEALGVEHAGQVGQAEADPRPDFFDHRARPGIAVGRRGRDVLAAHALGVAAGPAHDLVEASGQRRLPGQDTEAGTGREALPASPAPARTRRSRPGRRPCDRSRPRSRPSPPGRGRRSRCRLRCRCPA